MWNVVCSVLVNSCSLHNPKKDERGSCSLPDSHGAPTPDASVSIRPVWPDHWIDYAQPRDISARDRCDRLLLTFCCCFLLIYCFVYLFVCVFLLIRFILYIFLYIFLFISWRFFCGFVFYLFRCLVADFKRFSVEIKCTLINIFSSLL